MPHLCICEDCQKLRRIAKGKAAGPITQAITVLRTAGLLREADLLARLIAGDEAVIPGGPTPGSMRKVVVHPILIERDANHDTGSPRTHAARSTARG